MGSRMRGEAVPAVSCQHSVEQLQRSVGADQVHPVSATIGDGAGRQASAVAEGQAAATRVGERDSLEAERSRVRPHAAVGEGLSHVHRVARYGDDDGKTVLCLCPSE